MASSILSSLLSKPQFTIVPSTGGSAAATGIKVKRVSIQLHSKIPRHKREDGSSIVDTRIIEQTVIFAEIICPTLDDVEDVIALMNDRQTLYTITSKSLVFNNMMVSTAITKQTAEMLSAGPFQIVFTELLQENVNPVICQQAADSDNQDSGIQLLNNVANNVQTLVTTVSNNAVNAAASISGFFGG